MQQRTAVTAPASYSCRMPTICFCVNRLPRMLSSSGRCPNFEDSHFRWNCFQGQVTERDDSFPLHDIEIQFTQVYDELTPRTSARPGSFVPAVAEGESYHGREDRI
jgi:hypothetical protein